MVVGLDVVVAQGGGRDPDTADYALKSPTPLRKRTRYSFESATDYRMTGLSEAERTAALELPEDHHPRAARARRAMAYASQECGRHHRARPQFSSVPASSSLFMDAAAPARRYRR